MRTEALIDVNALTHNLNRVKALTPKAKVLAMIKANAYGHGLLLCGKTLDADYLGVATLEEAYALRLHGVSKRIVLTPGFQNTQELQNIIDLELDTFVHHPQQIELLQKYRGKYKIPVWFKFNTGMNRLGFAYDHAKDNLKQLEQLKNIEISCVLSHLACADQKNHPHLLMQLEQFANFVRELSYPKSILNSAGILHHPEHAYDIVRPGLMLYGATPCEDHSIHDIQINPVMTLTATVISISDIKAGEGIGYNQDWQAQRNSKIATIACGYGDGYPQRPKAAKVWYQDQLLPVVGRVSMDYLSVDITDCQHPIDLGTRVELWGKSYPVSEAAKAIGMGDYALLTGIMSRVPRRDSIAQHAYHQSFQQFKKSPQFKTKKFIKTN